MVATGRAASRRLALLAWLLVAATTVLLAIPFSEGAVVAGHMTRVECGQPLGAALQSRHAVDAMNGLARLPAPPPGATQPPAVTRHFIQLAGAATRYRACHSSGVVRVGAGVVLLLIAVALAGVPTVLRVSQIPSDALGRRVTKDLRSRLIWITARRGVPPLAAWCFARVLTTLRAGHGLFTFSASSWVHWDSFNYIAIAQHGYTFYRCPPGPKAPTWCGTAGWFPAYPLLLRVLGWFGAPAAEAGAVLAAVLLLATFAVLWNCFLLKLGWHRGVVLLLIAASFPGAVYGFAVFPMSLVSLAMISAFVAARHDRHLLMAAAVAIAVFAYPSSAVLVPIVAVYLAWLPAPSGVARLRRASLAAICAAPLAVVGLWHAVSLGHWDAFVLTQRQAGPTQDPLTSIWKLVVTQNSPIQSLPGNAPLRGWLAWQTLVTMLMLGAALVTIVAPWIKVARHSETKRPTWRQLASADDFRFEALGLAMVLGLWLFTLTTSNGAAQYRSVFALLPVVVLLRRVPVPVLWVTAAACAIVTYEISAYFFVFRGAGLV